MRKVVFGDKFYLFAKNHYKYCAQSIMRNKRIFFCRFLIFELILKNLLREADFCQLEISKIVKPTVITEIYNFNNQNAHCINIETFPSMCLNRWILKWSLFKYHTYLNCHIGKMFCRCNFFCLIGNFSNLIWAFAT